MRREAAIVLARQLAKQPILGARTGSGHLMLLVAVASLADGTNGAERLRLCRRDRQVIRVYAGRRMRWPALPLRDGGKQPVVLFSYDVVALADRVLEGLPVEDCDAATGVVDDSRRLQLAGRFGDAAARNT